MPGVIVLSHADGTHQRPTTRGLNRRARLASRANAHAMRAPLNAVLNATTCPAIVPGASVCVLDVRGGYATFTALSLLWARTSAASSIHSSMVAGLGER